MSPSPRVFLFLSLGMLAMAASGCGGSGNGTSPQPVTSPGAVTPTPTATPVAGSTTAPAAASPTAKATSVATAGTSPPVGAPSPVSTTLGSAQTVTTRPLASGDSFSYAGTLITTFNYNGSSPAPSSTSVATVSQTVTLSGPVTKGGVAGQTDVDTAESDVTSLATKTSTTDAYEALASGQLTESSYTQTTSDGYTIGITYPSPYVLDELPETSGQSWTNPAAESLSEKEPGGYSSSRTYAADGSYTDAEQYPSGTTASAGATPSATIIEYNTGSGTYSLPLQGYASNTIITVGTPSPVSSAGSSTIPLTLQVPDPTVSPSTALVPTWYKRPLALYTESNLQTGSKSLPAQCNVPASIATSGNAIVGSIERVDTVLGVDETISEVSYVAPTYGLVCYQMTDVASSFYDFSGQSLNGVAIQNVATPLTVETIQATVGLTTVNKIDAVVRGGGVSALALRSGPVRGAFDAAVIRARVARTRKALDALRAGAGAAR